MNPALSVLLLTTLLGSAQGLLLALFAAELASGRHWFGAAVALDAGFFASGALVAAALASAGLAASFFHLGRPARAWRSATMWRTSWLSREVIVLPAFIALAVAYGAAHALAPGASLLAGALAAAAAIVLFVCTAMIYATIRFLREWSTPLTPLNFVLFGCANGFTLAAAGAAAAAPAHVGFFAAGAIGFTSCGLLGWWAARRRKVGLVPKSTLQTAIGIKHSRIVQVSQGFTAGSFNTREFFHGRSAATLERLRACCVGAAFVLPLCLLAVAGLAGASAPLFAAAALTQYLGLLVERWLFFADVRHPQNLYYQRKG